MVIEDLLFIKSDHFGLEFVVRYLVLTYTKDPLKSTVLNELLKSTNRSLNIALLYSTSESQTRNPIK